MDNFSKYIPYLILAVFGYILWSMSKVQNLHTSLLINMAGKLGVLPDDELPAHQSSDNHTETRHNTNESELSGAKLDGEIVRVAEKVYAEKPMTKKEKEFYDKYKQQVDEEAGFFFDDDMKAVSDKITNGQEVTEDDIDFYKTNFETHSERLELKELVEAEANIIPSVPTVIIQPQNELERIHILLSFFDDGVPKNIGTLANLYADKTGLVASTGNTAKLLDKLLEQKKLMNQRMLHNKRNKVFYGLPQWFDGKKLEKSYKQKIA